MQVVKGGAQCCQPPVTIAREAQQGRQMSWLACQFDGRREEAQRTIGRQRGQDGWRNRSVPWIGDGAQHQEGQSGPVCRDRNRFTLHIGGDGAGPFCQRLLVGTGCKHKRNACHLPTAGTKAIHAFQNPRAPQRGHRAP